jgi:minor extracellular serine protease Vpr
MALGLVALVATTLVTVTPVRGAGDVVVSGAVSAWRGAFGSRPQAATPSKRMIVVLAAPSVADQAAGLRRSPTPAETRRWSTEAEGAQRLLLAKLTERGIDVEPFYSFTRTLNGFSASLDDRALAELERIGGVAGVYPVRTVYPASIGAETIGQPEFSERSGRRPSVQLPGFDGAGVTVALLDAGVQRGHAALRGRVLPGYDLVRGTGPAAARSMPGEPGRLETHGTRMAGILAGGDLVGGVAPGARILPLRVLGWHRTRDGSYAVLGRGDALVAGLERAVDPDRNGDLRDAADIALAPVVEPFAAFPDSPESRAVAGATRLGTLVVAAAGNDGQAGREGFGSVGGPGGAPDALTVGALDARSDLLRANATLRIDSDEVLDEPVRVLGAVAPRSALRLKVSALLGPSLGDGRRAPAAQASGAVLADFFDRAGASRVAGRAVLVPAGGSLAEKARNAAAAGASVLLVAGAHLPAGGLDLDEAAGIPVLAVDGRAAGAIASGLVSGRDVTLDLGAAEAVGNPNAGRVAPFSSGGLVFDGRVKPDLVAPGVGLVTADAGRSADGSPRVATATGSSAAAAVVAGAAALLADARPDLSAGELRGLLVGSAQQLEGQASSGVTVEGAGALDLHAAALTEVAIEPASLALGKAAGPGWSVLRGLSVRNLSTRTLRISFGVANDSAAGPEVRFAASPAALTLRPGDAGDVVLQAAAPAGGSGLSAGVFVVHPEGSRPVRLPWAVSFASAKAGSLVGDIRLSNDSFAPSPAAPTVVAFRAGAVGRGVEGQTIEPVRLLEGELWTAAGKRLGTLFRLRDLLPGRYAFGLTGRGPFGNTLRPGDYELRLTAEPVEGAEGTPPSTAKVMFTISGSGEG